MNHGWAKKKALTTHLEICGDYKMKLLIISEGYGRGGGDKVISDLSMHLPSDIETVIAAVKIDRPEDLFPYKGRLLHLPVRPTKFRFLRRTLEINKVIASEKPDIVLTFRRNYNYANILSLGRHKKIVSIHNYDADYFRTKGIRGEINKTLTRVLYNKSDLIIVLTGAMKDDLIKMFGIKPEKIKVIPNPCDIEHIQKLSTEKIEHTFFNTEEPIILNVGRLTRQKGQWHLIRAFNHVRQQLPCKLVIIGHGNLEGYLKRLVKDLGIEDESLFLGWQRNPFKYIDRSTLFVFPSLWEGFGLSLIEAMAIGCPVIASDCKYGPREILGNGEYGRLVPVCDGNFYDAEKPLTKEEEILAGAILELLVNKHVRENYIKMVKERVYEYEIHKVVNKYVDAFNSISGRA